MATKRKLQVKRRSPRVYIACPITSSGDMLENIRNATVAWRHLLSSGAAPFNPAANDLAVKIAVSYPPEWKEWMNYDYHWLDVSDALFRLPGKSKGANREVRRAHRLGIPVFYSFTKLDKWRTEVFLTSRKSILKKDTRSSLSKKAGRSRKSNGPATRKTGQR